MRYASIAFIMVSLLVLSGCREQPEDITQVQFPSHLRTKVELAKDQDGKGGRVRYLVFNEDKSKLIGVENEYPDGITEFEYYREDGSLREINGFYPLDPAGKAKTRKPKRTVLYDKNGKTVLFERSMRPDGTMETSRRSRPDGGFEMENFYPDGKTTKSHKIVTSSGDVTLEESFRQNGRLEIQTRKINSWESETTEYREDGSRLSVTTRGASRWSPIDKIVFGYDGVTVEMKVHYTSWAVEVEYRRADGTLAEKRNYTSYGNITVTSYGTDGKPKFRQEWRSSKSYPTDWTDSTDAKLTKIEELTADGSVAREIEMYDDGKTVKSTRVRDGVNYYSGTYRYFRPDGTLEKEEVKENYDKVKETKEFKPEDNVRETLPSEYLWFPSRPRPKMLSSMPEEQQYYRYGENGYDGPENWDD